MPFDSSRRAEYEYRKNYGPESSRKKVVRHLFSATFSKIVLIITFFLVDPGP